MTIFIPSVSLILMLTHQKHIDIHHDTYLKKKRLYTFFWICNFTFFLLGGGGKKVIECVADGMPYKLLPQQSKFISSVCTKMVP